MQTQRSIEETAEVSQELREELALIHARYAVVFRGVCLGKLRVAECMYIRYQFANALEIPGKRVLEILIAENKDGRCLIRESESAEAGNDPVFLLSYIVDDSEFESPTLYFRNHYPDENMSDHVGRSMQISLSGKDEGKICLLERDQETGEPVWHERRADVTLRWVVRSRLKYYLFHLAYLYAVPIDIVTLPCRLIFSSCFRY
jgi:hypothetical protein